MIQSNEKFQVKNWELVSVNPSKKNWNWTDYFSFWAVNFQSVIGFSLIVSLYMLYDLNSVIVFLGCLLATILVFIFSNLIGKISQNTGLSFPVILRISSGFNGARYIGMARGLVGIVLFGVQTFFISKSIGYLIRIFLYEIDKQILDNEIFLIFFFGMNNIDWFSFLFTLVFQFYLYTRSHDTVKNFIKFSAYFVYFGLIFFLVIIISENFNEVVKSLKLSTQTENVISKKNIFPLLSVTGTIFAYFSIVILNFGDFSRYARNINQMKIGNYMIIVNLIFFSILSVLIAIGSDLILNKSLASPGRFLSNPTDIIGKFDNNYLTIYALVFILVSSLSTNLIANYIPSQNTLINFLPNSLNVKNTGIIIIVLGLVVGMFWSPVFSQSSIMLIVNTFASIFGPMFGLIICDYYLIKKQKINHKELFYPNEKTEYIYSNGWNLKAMYSLLIGFIFSASTIWNLNLISFQSFGWIIGAFISWITYYLLTKK